MKLPDTNIWLALTLSGHTHHKAARDWLDAETDSENIFFCRSTQQSLLRLLSTAGVLSAYGIEPLSNAASWAVYDAFMADDRISLHAEPLRLDAKWKMFAARKSSSPKLWMDAYLAAFAITLGAQLVTTDKAFTQFAGLDLLVIAPS